MESLQKRFIWLYAVVIALLSVLLLRLAWVQVVKGDEYRGKARKQQTKEFLLPAKRGEIYMREKDEILPVATTKKGWLLSIDPRLVKNAGETFAAISKLGITDIAEDDFTARANKKNDPYEVIGHRLPYEAKKIFDDSRIQGVFLAPEEWRFYPAGALAAQTIGFVGADGTGQYGIERYFDEDLLGKDGAFIGEKTLSGKILRFGKKIIYPEQDGINLLLTIDAGAQAYLEKQLDGIMEKYNASSVGGVIINPETGGVYAMASLPTFNPNAYSEVSSIDVFKNPIVESRFEMGSVVKPLTMASALDAGVVDPDTTYIDRGVIKIDGVSIKNFDGRARGRTSMQEILSQSLNLGAVFLMDKLGVERFRGYMDAFGLGEPVGIDLPNEVAGTLENLYSNRRLEAATASFGQGIAITPIELARAIGSIANGGTVVSPYVVGSLIYDDGERVEKKLKRGERVISEKAARTVTRMLVDFVDNHLKRIGGAIPGYTVAAKTGTAQIAYSHARGYSDEPLHAFVGYSPAYDPKFLIFLYMEKPHGARYSSQTLTGPFRSTMQFLLSYFEVPPDRPWEQ